MRRSVTAVILLALLLMVAATPGFAGNRDDEPEVVVVQHILIGFKRSTGKEKLDRTKAEAKALAQELFERARSGEDFDALVKEYTNDRYPGIMKLTNTGAPRMSGATVRKGVVPRFGDVAFSLEVGEIGLADHHPGNSPYGWHVIKRLE